MFLEIVEGRRVKSIGLNFEGLVILHLEALILPVDLHWEG